MLGWEEQKLWSPTGLSADPIFTVKGLISSEVIAPVLQSCLANGGSSGGHSNDFLWTCFISSECKPLKDGALSCSGPQRREGQDRQRPVRI